MNVLHRYIMAVIVEKAQRGQKDKRLLYHTGPRPAIPKPVRYGGAGTSSSSSAGWVRPWLDKSIKSGVFLTPNPVDIAMFHGVSGNVYAYKVPEWVIEKSGGVQRFDSGSEILIPEEVWTEAEDEIEFLGKTMSQDELWSKVDSSMYSAREQKGKRYRPTDVVNIRGLRVTQHPEAAIKMMKPKEREKALAALEAEYPADPEREVMWPDPGDRRTIMRPAYHRKPDETDQNLMDLLKKYLNESLTREYIRELLTESRFKQMTKAKYRDLDGYLASAPFMRADAGSGDYEFDDNDDHRYRTPASIQLQKDLNDYFDRNMGNVVVSAIVTVDESITPANAGSRAVVKTSNYHFKDGKHLVYVLMSQLGDGLTYADSFGKGSTSHLAQVIRHELLHMNQFLQFSEGKPTEELYDEFMEEYSKAQSSGWKDEPYHTFDIGFSERETFAHQIADELVDELGTADAREVLDQKGGISHDRLRKHSPSYEIVTKDLQDPDTEGVLDMLARARSYVIQIGKLR